jgi:hypothetical protein
MGAGVLEADGDDRGEVHVAVAVAVGLELGMYSDTGRTVVPQPPLRAAAAAVSVRSDLCMR